MGKRTSSPSCECHAWFRQLNHFLQAGRNRAIVVLSGPSDWLQRHLDTLPPAPSTFWLTGDENKTSPLHPPAHATRVSATDGIHHLGEESHQVWVDGWTGVDANAVLQLAGTLRAGGVLIWLLPPLAQWQNQANPVMVRWISEGGRARSPSLFYQWLIRHLTRSPVLFWAAGHPPPTLPDNPFPFPSSPASVVEKVPLFWTADQRRVLQYLPRLQSHHTLWIVARRGRGKSTLLGEVAHRLGGRRIIVSNRKAGLHSLFAQLKRQGWQMQRRNHWRHPEQTGEIRFMAPDAFLQKQPYCDTLLVDEAARLTLPVLQRLMTTPAIQVLATTLEGYEGAGQGLQHRAAALLPPERHWIDLTLSEPVRWSREDPLEPWLDRVFQTGPLSDDPLPPRPGPLTFAPVDLATLPPEQWQALFALLRRAHYQTRPSDLMQLLDEENLQLWAAWSCKYPAAVLWARPEGGLANPPSHIRGHLVAQRLAHALQNPDWLRWRSLRITRIAVQPVWQGQGAGTRLTKTFLQTARQRSELDFISVSCAARPELIRFWQRLGFEIHWRGQRPHRASGWPSIILIHPLKRCL